MAIKRTDRLGPLSDEEREKARVAYDHLIAKVTERARSEVEAELGAVARTRRRDRPPPE